MPRCRQHFKGHHLKMMIDIMSYLYNQNISSNPWYSGTFVGEDLCLLESFAIFVRAEMTDQYRDGIRQAICLL